MTTEPTGHDVPRYLVSRHHMHAWRENVMVTDHIGMVTYADHVAAIRACEARLYTLMGAAIQSGIEAEQKRIRFAVAALVDGDVIDLSLSEYRAVVDAINEEES